MTALDFSYARPGGTALNAAGVTSVGRYLATDGRGITLPELTEYLNCGISVWFIKENAARGMLNGYGQGQSDAQAAQDQLSMLGQPNAAVYFTADFDIQENQYAAGDSYLQGVASVIPVTRIGLYAGIAYLNHAAGLYTYQWKIASSSFDHGQLPDTQLHLIQTLDAVPIPNTDYNIMVQANHGQVGNTTTPTPIESDNEMHPLGVMYQIVNPAGGLAGVKILVGPKLTVMPNDDTAAFFTGFVNHTGIDKLYDFAGFDKPIPINQDNAELVSLAYGPTLTGGTIASLWNEAKTTNKPTSYPK